MSGPKAVYCVVGEAEMVADATQALAELLRPVELWWLVRQCVAMQADGYGELRLTWWDGKLNLISPAPSMKTTRLPLPEGRLVEMVRGLG